MKNFRTNKTFIILHIFILVLLIIYTINDVNRQSNLNVKLLSVMIAVVFIMLISSLIKKVIVTEDNIIVKSLFKTTTIEIDKIGYGYAISAMGRFVLIINDGTHTAMISSLMNGFNEIVALVSSKIVEEERKAFNIITENSLKRKYVIYTCVMLIIVALLIYGNITSYNLI